MNELMLWKKILGLCPGDKVRLKKKIFPLPEGSIGIVSHRVASGFYRIILEQPTPYIDHAEITVNLADIEFVEERN